MFQIQNIPVFCKKTRKDLGQSHVFVVIRDGKVIDRLHKTEKAANKEMTRLAIEG